MNDMSLKKRTNKSVFCETIHSKLMFYQGKEDFYSLVAKVYKKKSMQQIIA